MIIPPGLPGYPRPRFVVLTEDEARVLYAQVGREVPAIDLHEPNELSPIARRITGDLRAAFVQEHFWVLDFEGQPDPDGSLIFDKRTYPRLQNAQDALELEQRRRDRG